MTTGQEDKCCGKMGNFRFVFNKILGKTCKKSSCLRNYDCGTSISLYELSYVGETIFNSANEWTNACTDIVGNQVSKI